MQTQQTDNSNQLLFTSVVIDNREKQKAILFPKKERLLIT